MSGFDWNWQFALETLPPLFEGLRFTLEATLFGSALAFVLGLVWAIARLAEIPIASQLVRLWVEFIRGTPLLIQLYFLFYIFPTSGVTLHEVRSAVIIDATPAQIWPHVVAFRALPEPTALAFRLGIAYPRYARIEGSGVGAVRYCVFSTGPFVEPITAWEPGRRLAFDVVRSPDPMRELTPYARIGPPHLDGYLRSERGEFRLVALPDGRTRLEGSTWYRLSLAPEPYWQVIADHLIHTIHLTVLNHIADEVRHQP